MIEFTLLHPRMTQEHLGLIPHFLSLDDERPAAQQIDANYEWGGWSPFEGFKMSPDGRLSYRGDPDLIPLASARLRDEEIFFYPHAWVAIRQPNGSFEVSRID